MKNMRCCLRICRQIRLDLDQTANINDEVEIISEVQIRIDFDKIKHRGKANRAQLVCPHFKGGNSEELWRYESTSPLVTKLVTMLMVINGQ